MARYGPADVTVSVAAATVPDVTVVSEIPVEMILEEITPLGSAWETHGSVGVKRSGDITLEAPYSDDVGNLRDKIQTAGVGATVAIVLTYGSTKTTSFSAIIKSFNRVIARGALTVFRAVLTPTGALTEA